jgi:hypothetical protein
MTHAKKTAKAKDRHRRPAGPAPGRGRGARLASPARRLKGLLKATAAGATSLIGHVPGTVRATRTGAQGTTNALQTLPDATLRWMAAGSVGLGAGLRLARAPRIVVAAGVVPALLVGAAIVLRPEPAGDPEAPPA